VVLTVLLELPATLVILGLVLLVTQATVELTAAWAHLDILVIQAQTALLVLRATVVIPELARQVIRATAGLDSLVTVVTQAQMVVLGRPVTVVTLELMGLLARPVTAATQAWARLAIPVTLVQELRATAGLLAPLGRRAIVDTLAPMEALAHLVTQATVELTAAWAHLDILDTAGFLATLVTVAGQAYLVVAEWSLTPVVQQTTLCGERLLLVP
jgi:hypothetical protein